MTKRISQLTALTGVDLADSVPLVDNSTGQTKKATILEIKKNIYAFYAYRSSAWTTANATFGKVALNAELYDYNSNFDATTNNRYTAPIAGLYHFDASVQELATASGAVNLAALYKNGVEILRGNEGSSSGAVNNSHGVSGDIELAATDYIELFFYGNNKSGGATSVLTRLSGHLVAPL